MSGYTGTLYLNNSGSRWVNLNEGKRDKVTLSNKSGATITRSVNYYSMFGNHITVNICYKGVRRHVFTDTVLED
jgi:hypothetical protein